MQCEMFSQETKISSSSKKMLSSRSNLYVRKKHIHHHFLVNGYSEENAKALLCPNISW